MPSLDLTVRYFQDSPPPGKPYREEHFIRREVDMALPVEAHPSYWSICGTTTSSRAGSSVPRE